MSASLKIADGMTAAELRHWARRCGNGRAAARAYAIANALDGLDRAEAARLAGMVLNGWKVDPLQAPKFHPHRKWSVAPVVHGQPSGRITNSPFR